MCMIGDITYIDDLPNFDQSDNYYALETKFNLAEQSTTSFWEEEVQFQLLEYSN